MVEENLLTIRILEGIEKSEVCPLCYLWFKFEERHMDFLLTEKATMSSAVRKEVLNAKGFCNRHAHLLYKTAHEGHPEDGVGYAVYMQEIVRSIGEHLEPLINNLSSLEDIKRDLLHRRKQRRTFSLLVDTVEHALQGQQQCPICRYLQSWDKVHMHTFIQMLEDKDFQKMFKSSKGLCLPHFESAIRTLGRNKFRDSSNMARTLIETEIERLRLVEHHLSEFVRKQSWDFRDELLGPEVNANNIVLNLLVGVEGICLNGKQAK
jgi:hypothetical protein